MSSTTVLERGAAEEHERFRHDAMFYAGPANFVDRTASFIRDSVRADEPILVVVSAEKIDLLKNELEGESEGVRFADMAAVGHNPARIIPAWRAFVAEQSIDGRRFRGVGEPIWATRSSNELVECERHEALLNLAFADAPAWWLACPYDTETLPPGVLREAERNHPFVVDAHGTHESGTYRGLEDVTNPFDLRLPEPPTTRAELAFEGEGDHLRSVRGRVAEAAAVFGLDPARADDLVLAVSEVATNSVRHGGGRGVLRIWHEDRTLICEIRDAGRIDDPLVGRGQPPGDRDSGFGLWLANQLCDLVQIRTFDDGSVVRLHVRR
jgi:anti-sigma regulatory factor (Ser/Thr protein kinase)